MASRHVPRVQSPQDRLGQRHPSGTGGCGCSVLFGHLRTGNGPFRSRQTTEMFCGRSM